METQDLPQITDAFRRHWSVESCDVVDVPVWHPGNPARGQCGVTALILQEILGGELLVADVLFGNGETQGVHYWNRLPDGVEVDLTREQFNDNEFVQLPQVAVRTQRKPKRLSSRYELLRTAILNDLTLRDHDLTLIWPEPA